MRKVPALRVLVVIGVLFATAILASADPPSVVGRLNLATGPVSFLPGSLDQWAPAVTNYPMSGGDHLWVDQGGRAEIHVGSAALRLDAGTEMSFLNLDEQIVQLGLSQGSLIIRLRSLEPGDTWEIDTPNSVVTLLQTGSYRIDVSPYGDVGVTVRGGSAEVAAANDVFTVRAGATATVSGTDYVEYYVQRAPRPDAWDAWSTTRDAREDRLTSVRFVPREMVGMEDLDGNGDWFTVSGYGPVWSPNRVPAGWAPYRFGRWAWVTPWGWTWIDDAAWGFTPFHYGRWAFSQDRWVWIPGTIVARPVYAPALVVFVGGSGSDSVGWFPLGPREVYVPPYQASTTYVQRINVTSVTTITVQVIQQTNVTRVSYVNRNVSSAVTVQPRRSFVQARPTSESVVVPTAADARRLTTLSMTVTLQPQRESILGQAVNPQRPAARPPADVSARQVFSRTAPAPGRQSFIVTATAQRQSVPVAAPLPQVRVLQLDPSNRVQTPPTTRESANRQTSRPGQSAAQGRQSPVGSAAATQSRLEAQVQTLLGTLDVHGLPDAQKSLDKARTTRGIRLDYNGLKKQLEDLRKNLTAAQKNQKAGKLDQALAQGQDIQRLVDQLEKTIADAVDAAGGTSSERQSPQGQGQGRSQGGGSNSGRSSSP